MGLNISEILEGGRIRLVFRVHGYIRHGPRILRAAVSIRIDQRCVFVIIRRRVQRHEVLNLLFPRLDQVVDRTAPDFALGKCAQVEAGDDAEVVAPAFKGEVEVGVGFGVGIDDAAVSQDDFVVDDVVADEAVAWGEIGYAA